MFERLLSRALRFVVVSGPVQYAPGSISISRYLREFAESRLSHGIPVLPDPAILTSPAIREKVFVNRLAGVPSLRGLQLNRRAGRNWRAVPVKQAVAVRANPSSGPAVCGGSYRSKDYASSAPSKW